MEKCLLTKLQAVVNDATFPKFQYLKGKLTVPPSGSYYQAVITSGASVVVNNTDVPGLSYTWEGTGANKLYAAPAAWGGTGDVINVEFYEKKDFLELANSGYIGVDLIAMYANRVNTTSINAFGSKSWGNIEDLYRLVSLISINIQSCPEMVGDIRNFAIKMVGAGRASGTLSIYCSDTGLTLDGVGNPGNKRITFDSSLEDGYSISNL